MYQKVEIEHLISHKPDQLKHMTKKKQRNMEEDLKPRMMNERINFSKPAPNIGKPIMAR